MRVLFMCVCIFGRQRLIEPLKKILDQKEPGLKEPGLNEPGLKEPGLKEPGHLGQTIPGSPTFLLVFYFLRVLKN